MEHISVIILLVVMLTVLLRLGRIEKEIKQIEFNKPKQDGVWCIVKSVVKGT